MSGVIDGASVYEGRS